MIPLTPSPTPAPSLADRLAAELHAMADLYPALLEARIPGAERPPRPAELGAEAREERDWLARMERHERADLAPGEAPVPVRLDIVDLMTDILADAVLLDDALAEAAGIAPLWPPSTGLDDPRPYLRQAAALCGGAERSLLRWAAPIVREMTLRAARALVLADDGQLVPVVCPWCKGLSPQTPAGGGYTWRVRMLPGDMIAIVCEGLCSPPLRQVGTWWQGQPCWPLAQWAWLAKHATAAADRKRARAS